MDKAQTKKLEGLLKDELATLEKELQSIGQRNPNNPADWEAKPDQMDTLASDSNDVADSIESYEENTGILKQLEIRYNEVKKALERISSNKYGLCEVDKHPIELERLEANPAATTCLKHLK